MALTASPGTLRRFSSTLLLFFDAVSRQAQDRATGQVPDLESYIELRRDTSGCKPCWALIAYANNLDLPDEVMDHPLVVSLGEAANDLVTWSNVRLAIFPYFFDDVVVCLRTHNLQDIFSYNVEQARHDTHNMIEVLMHHQSLALQSAVDVVGELCKQSIDRFIEDRAALSELSPTWGAKIDREVSVYVEGLASWIVGSLHWSGFIFIHFHPFFSFLTRANDRSFESERYFGRSGMEIKKTRVVHLLPKVAIPSSR